MKTLNSYLENLFYHAKQVTKLEQGLTNDNYYIVTEKNEEIVVRLTKSENQHLFVRNVEAAITKLLEPYDIDVPCLYFDPNTGNKVTKYIPNSEHKNVYSEKELVSVATLLLRFHSLHLACPIEFQPLLKLNQYYENIKNPPLELSQYEDLKLRFHHYYIHSKKVLCHNDVVQGNLLFTPDNIYLIDYEYAANNDIMFDLASFLSENNIDDVTQQTCFLKAYFQDTWDDSLLPYFTTYFAFEDLLWSTWAYMRYEQTQQTIFLEIYHQKLARLRSTIKTL